MRAPISTEVSWSTHHGWHGTPSGPRLHAKRKQAVKSLETRSRHINVRRGKQSGHRLTRAHTSPTYPVEYDLQSRYPRYNPDFPADKGTVRYFPTGYVPIRPQTITAATRASAHSAYPHSHPLPRLSKLIPNRNIAQRFTTRPVMRLISRCRGFSGRAHLYPFSFGMETARSGGGAS